MMMDDLRPVASPRVERIQGIIHLYLRSLAIVLLLFCTIVAVDQLSAWARRRLVGDQAFQLAQ